MHRYSPAPDGDGPKAQILASGIAMPWALEAQRLLHTDWDVQADVWSVTSWTAAAPTTRSPPTNGTARIPSSPHESRTSPGA